MKRFYKYYANFDLIFCEKIKTEGERERGWGNSSVVIGLHA